MINKLEDKLIFPVLRFISILGIFILIIAALVSIIPDSIPHQTTYKDVTLNIAAEPDSSRSAKIILPKTLNSLDEDAKTVVINWAEFLKEEYQKEFLSGLEEVVKKASKETGTFDGNILNKYKELEYERLDKIESAKNASVFEAALKSMILLVITVCLVLFCNLLALLKIIRLISDKKHTS